MQVVKKINNNVAICLDNAGNEVVAFGKGIGFGQIPYEVELKKIDRTYYYIDGHYLNLLTELPEEIFLVSDKIVERGKKILDKQLSSNVVFSLADHIGFAIERLERGMIVKMPFAYDIQHLYPKELMLGEVALKLIKKELKRKLPDSETIGIALHFINCSEENVQFEQDMDAETIINKMTEIIEDMFSIKIQRDSYNCYRFCCHIRYFVKRISEEGQFTDNDPSLYEHFKKEYPKIYDCAAEIEVFLKKEYQVSCSREEILYLMMHINRLCVNEDCNH